MVYVQIDEDEDSVEDSSSSTRYGFGLRVLKLRFLFERCLKFRVNFRCRI